jgi:hypothetical protein
MSLDDRLSRIDTMWSVVHRAHADKTMEVRRAQEELLDRYSGAVRRYLLGAMREVAATKVTAKSRVWAERVIVLLQGLASSFFPCGRLPRPSSQSHTAETSECYIFGAGIIRTRR